MSEPVNEDPPKVGEVWVNRHTGLWWRCVSVDPVVFMSAWGRRKQPSLRALALSWRRR